MIPFNFTDSSDVAAGVCPAPPPPPPPPVPGQVPALRISTTESSTPRPKPSPSSDPYEPPAAIQNAMLTKDKKPFTYTPGMGGKLDLSQIRSPRMARRVAKNANDEGIEGPPKSALEPKPSPTQAGANIFIQPQVAVPVFPSSMPAQPMLNKTVTVVNNVNRAPVSPPEKCEPARKVEPTKNIIRVETKPVPNTTASLSSPETPTSPTQVTLAKAPTPWMKRNKSQEEELPEWARRTNKSQESTPENANSPPIYVVQQGSPPPPPQRNQIPQSIVVNQRPQPQMKRQPNNEHVIPLNIEDRPSVFSVKHEPGHHQFKQSSPHHQQRWGQQNPQQNQVPIQVQVQARPNQNQNQIQYRPQEQVQPSRQNQVTMKPQSQQSGGTYIIPMVIEGKESNSPSTLLVQSSIPSQTRIIPIQPQSPPVNLQRNLAQQTEPGPIQSKSFRVLQKITSTDTPDEVDGDQLRKLQLTEDDRMLMNKFKEQVDNDNYLHQEEDPRYRGAAIPSRAFRYLQNMTDAGEITSNTLPRVNNTPNKKQNRNSKTFDDQSHLPPSEQQVTEPKKYTGSAIPSKSFKILQAMTQPQSIASHEYHQADFICQTENSMMGNQQGLFFSHYPPIPYWNPEDSFWGYYPLPTYALPPNCVTPPPLYCTYNNAYSFYPVPNTYIPSQFAYQQMDNNYTNPNESLPSERNTRNVNNEITQPLQRSSVHLFSPETTDMTTLTDDHDFSMNSKTKMLRPHVNDSDSEEEFSKNDSSNSDSDSDSYLAYSTGLNPMGNGDDSCRYKDCTSPSASTISEDTYEQSFSEKQSDYTESDEDSQKEDFECNNQENEHGTTTVSVSLPLRLRFSVSENNEDVTTVIVGDSTITPDKNSKNKDTDFQISRENTVDFTLKRKKKIEVPPEIKEDLHAEFTIRMTNINQIEVGNSQPDKCLSSSSFTANFETDDEDSGVTSDVSRIISEIDTDSECCPVKRQNKFQRTQTHSRLFKLLTEETSSDSVEDRRRNRFSLPADFDSFDYEEYCSSNDSSWKRMHESVERKTDSHNDLYYQKWKTSKSLTDDAVARNVGNEDGSTVNWTCKVNIHCPRIKSSKNMSISTNSDISKF